MVWDLISKGADLITGRQSESRQMGHDRNMFRKNADLQREFGKESLGWRVADARKHGIHPLAALGVNMSGASFAGGASNIGSGSGSSIGDAIRSVGDAEMQKANLRLVNAQADMLEQQALDSVASRAAQASNHLQREPAPTISVNDEPLSKLPRPKHSDLVGSRATLHTPYGKLKLREWPQGQALEEELGEGGTELITIARLVDSIVHQMMGFDGVDESFRPGDSRKNFKRVGPRIFGLSKRKGGE